MNRWLASKVFKIDKETSDLVIIKNKSLVPWRAPGFIFSNPQAIGLYLLWKGWLWGGRGHLQTKILYFLSIKNTGKKVIAQGKHKEFCLDGSVATLMDWIVHA